MARNPYSRLPDHHFWSRAVAWPAPGQLDPVVRAPRIGTSEKVVTMGSCFAQHLARNLASLGLNHFVSESPPDGMSPEDAKRNNYGLFSARYGNVYTVRQGLQLFQRAFGTFSPEDDVWETTRGFVDCFRPQMDPAPHPTAETVRAAAVSHLAAVRRMFESADWLIFTLGLTEGWRSVHDGTMYPVAPGVAGGTFDPSRYEFINFTADAVKRDLVRLIDGLAEVNPRCRLILTVSPVPLIATYEDRHVLVSTVASKSILRVAADEVERMYPHVTYFPSFEIITSPSAGNTYFEDDLRSVSDIGVKHVMRVFRKHFVDVNGVSPLDHVEETAREAAPALAFAKDGPSDVICDEDLIETVVAASNIARA